MEDNNFRMTLTEAPSNVRLSEAIARRMQKFGETEDAALRALVHTDEGLALYEAARKERLASSPRFF